MEHQYGFFVVRMRLGVREKTWRRPQDALFGIHRECTNIMSSGKSVTQDQSTEREEDQKPSRSSLVLFFYILREVSFMRYN